MLISGIMYSLAIGWAYLGGHKIGGGALEWDFLVCYFKIIIMFT